jgi:hypothetical protein
MAKDLSATNCYEYEHKQHSNITAKNGDITRYDFNNKEKQYFFSKRQIDGCVIKHEKACDWLLYFQKGNKEGRENNHLIFVELKGEDLIGAIAQIEKTIKWFNFHDTDFTIHARVVLTKAYAPDVRDNRFLKFVERIKIDKKGTFDFGSQSLNENILTKQ